MDKINIKYKIHLLKMVDAAYEYSPVMGETECPEGGETDTSKKF